MTPEDLAKSGTEDAHQAALFCWAQLQLAKWPMLRWLHAIPNGGQRGGKHGAAAAGAKMKATGVKAGVWDIHLPMPADVVTQSSPDAPAMSRRFVGLYIEMKKPGVGKLSPKQIEFRKHLEYYGYWFATCWSWEEARDEIIKYMENVDVLHTGSYRNYTEEEQ